MPRAIVAVLPAGLAVRFAPDLADRLVADLIERLRVSLPGSIAHLLHLVVIGALPPGLAAPPPLRLPGILTF